MKHIIYFLLLSLLVIVTSCKREYNITIDINTPEKIIMEVGDSLLIHVNGAKRYLVSTTSCNRYNYNFNPHYPDIIHDSIICYKKNIVVNGEIVQNNDVYVYLHAARAGIDTLLIDYFWHEIPHTSEHRYPILVIDKQSTTKKTSRIEISL